MIDLDNLAYNHILFERKLNESLIEQMEYESELLLNAHRLNIISEADVAKATVAKEKAKGILDRIAEFFKKIFGVFKTKTKELIDFNAVWWKENINVIEDIDYTGLSVQATPYWEVKNADIADTLDRLSDLLTVTPNGLLPGKGSLADSLRKIPLLGKLSADTEDDIVAKVTEILTASFRTGTPVQKEQVTLSGNDLKTKCTGEFKSYCLDYQKNNLQIIQTRMNKVEANLAKANQSLARREQETATKESWCLLEGCTLGDTFLSGCYNADIIFEAEEPAKPTEQKTPDAKEKDKPSPTSVTINDTTKDGDKKDTNEYDNKDTDELKRIQKILTINQKAIGIAMNVMEEKYKVYMDILKKVVAARKPKK